MPEPFSTPLIAAADAARLLCCLLGVFCAPAGTYCLLKPISWGQRCRFAALGAIAVAVVGGQLDLLGDPPTWRLPFIVVGMILAVAGLTHFLLECNRQERLDQEDREPGTDRQRVHRADRASGRPRGLHSDP